MDMDGKLAFLQQPCASKVLSRHSLILLGGFVLWRFGVVRVLSACSEIEAIFGRYCRLDSGHRV